MLPSQKCCRKVAKETTYFQAWYQSENLMRAAAFLLFTENFVVNHLRHIVKAKYKTFQATTSTYYNYMYTLSSLDHVATLPTIPIYLITSYYWCQTVNVVDCKVE